MRMSEPEDVARELFDGGWTSHMYMEGVQSDRLNRLHFWKVRGIQPLIRMETELVDYGFEVLMELRRLESQ